MPKVLVVFGATGQQGGSVVSSVLEDPSLSAQYKIRAITRDATSETARALEKAGAEVLQANINDEKNLHAAFHGAHTAFFVGAPEMGPNAFEFEKNQGVKAADIAVEEGVEYFIYSTLPHVTKVSGGKYTLVAGFDAKAEVEDHIRTLPIKSAFFAPGSFMENWNHIMKPQANPEGVYEIRRHVSPQTRLPLICTTRDTGKYVGAILAEPEKYEGKRFCAATRLYSMLEIAEIISKSTGKDVRYVQISEEEHRKSLPPWGGYLIQMMSYQEEYGYYGANQEEKVSWAAQHARGTLTSFEEYLRLKPLNLE